MQNVKIIINYKSNPPQSIMFSDLWSVKIFTKAVIRKSEDPIKQIIFILKCYQLYGSYYAVLDDLTEKGLDSVIDKLRKEEILK